MDRPPHFSDWLRPEAPAVKATESMSIENLSRYTAAAKYAQSAAVNHHQDAVPPPAPPPPPPHVVFSRQAGPLSYLTPNHAPRKDWGSELERHIVQYGTEYERQQQHQQQLLLQHQQQLLLQQQQQQQQVQIEQQHKHIHINQEQVKQPQGPLHQHQPQIVQNHVSQEISQVPALPSHQQQEQLQPQQQQPPEQAKEGYVSMIISDAPKRQPKKKRTKVKKPKPDIPLSERKTFKKLVRKQMYQTGKQYVDGKGKFHPSRQVKPACELSCKYGCFNKVSEDKRTELLDEFWALSKEDKFEYIINTTANEQKLKKRKKDTSERRQRSYKYYLLVRGKRERVCKKFYMKTLDISQRRVYIVHEKAKKGKGVPVLIDSRGHMNSRRIPEADRVFAKVHIQSYPKLPPDVKITTKNQKALEADGIYSVVKMYKFYVDTCKALNTNPVKQSYYRYIFKELTNPKPPLATTKILSECKNIEFMEKQTMTLSDLDDSQVERACREYLPLIPSEYIRTPKAREPRSKEATWRKVVRREMYQTGQQYVDYKGNIKPERQVKPACSPKCKYQCSEKITDAFRHNINHRYWGLSKAGKANFLAATTELIHGVKQRKKKTKVRRHRSYHYLFQVNGKEVRVCKKFYLSTLDISQKRIYTIYEKQQDSSGNNDIDVDKRGKTAKIPEEDKEFARRHIESFPPVPTQYVRVTNKNKEFLESIGVQSVAKLYALYKGECEAAGRKAISCAQYRIIRNSTMALRLLPYIGDTHRESIPPPDGNPPTAPPLPPAISEPTPVTLLPSWPPPQPSPTSTPSLHPPH